MMTLVVIDIPSERPAFYRGTLIALLYVLMILRCMFPILRFIMMVQCFRGNVMGSRRSLLYRLVVSMAQFLARSRSIVVIVSVQHLYGISLLVFNVAPRTLVAGG